jgi:hypothetical protein
MNTPLGLIGKNRPMTAISPHAAQAELITTAAQEIAAVNSMVNASRWQKPHEQILRRKKTAWNIRSICRSNSGARGHLRLIKPTLAY